MNTEKRREAGKVRELWRVFGLSCEWEGSPWRFREEGKDRHHALFAPREKQKDVSPPPPSLAQTLVLQLGPQSRRAGSDLLAVGRAGPGDGQPAALAHPLYGETAGQTVSMHQD